MTAPARVAPPAPNKEDMSEQVASVIGQQRIAYERKLKEISRKEVELLLWEQRLRLRSEELVLFAQSLEAKERLLDRETLFHCQTGEHASFIDLRWNDRVSIAQEEGKRLRRTDIL